MNDVIVLVLLRGQPCPSTLRLAQLAIHETGGSPDAETGNVGRPNLAEILILATFSEEVALDVAALFLTDLLR